MTSKFNLKILLCNKKIGSIIGKLIFLIPLLWVVALGVSLIESITYRGFFLKHTSIDPIIFYVLLGITEILGLFHFKQKKNRLFIYFQKINYFLSILFFITFIVFNFIENITYKNFIFSNLHVNIKALSYPVILTIYTDFVLLSSRYLILAVIFWILVGNLSKIWVKNSENMFYIFNNPNASYKIKMEKFLGKQFYDYTLFVKENTPEGSKIIIPPFGAYPWPQTGNDAYMRFFLYPRTLLNGEEYSAKYDLEKEGIDYILLVWGETEATSGNYTHGWPKFDVKAEKTILQINESEKKEEKGDYIYDKYKNIEAWGVIKVKK